MTADFWLEQAITQLTAAGCDAPRREARLLLEAVQGAGSGVQAKDKPLTPEQSEKFEALLQRRLNREPMTQILGQAAFWSLDFAVNSHTLSPRPDSETLIEALLARTPDTQAPLKILDLGTGTGCLLLTLLHELPNATGLGIDASAEALKVAQANARRLQLEERARFATGNWAQNISETYAMVISNPPYIAHGNIAALMPEVRDYEPHAALDGGEDGLDAYRAIIADLPRLLQKGGIAGFELGIGQAQAVQALGEAQGLQHLETRRDLSGIERTILFTHN